MRHADHSLGKLSKVLEDQGVLDNTLVIVTADNGTPCLRSKADIYDCGLHEPMVLM